MKVNVLSVVHQIYRKSENERIFKVCLSYVYIQFIINQTRDFHGFLPVLSRAHATDSDCLSYF